MKPTTPEYTVLIKRDNILFRFYNKDRIYGPFKFYISRAEEPTIVKYIISPSAIYQRWAHDYVEASFAYADMNHLITFYFTAVTIVPGEERPLAAGEVRL